MSDRSKYASQITLGRALSDAMDAMQTAYKYGDVVSAIKYANIINGVETLIETYEELYDEDPNLVAEIIESENHKAHSEENK